eukprot:c3008_g1_i1.p1 GENE.c3008_g1_i1~~c3008_g1_i1.p1  ORF type:complete len:306 (+),score=152.70 c3008_g1_i1:25-918(+)
MEDKAQVAADYIFNVTKAQPKVAIVCGSGLKDLADLISDPKVVSFSDIPHFPTTSVPGHSGKFVFGELDKVQVVIIQGRVHLYEGLTADEVTRYVRILAKLGTETLILTNAAGGINKDYSVGDVVYLTDHVSFASFAANGPMMGIPEQPNKSRFFDMTMAYSVRLRALTHLCAKESNLSVKEGVYACVGGPNFETPAEIRALRTLGCDCVGMSTAPEVTVARYCGMRCAAFSIISNVCVDQTFPSEEAYLKQMGEATHSEVLHNVADHGVPTLKKLLLGMIKQMGENPERWKHEGSL